MIHRRRFLCLAAAHAVTTPLRAVSHEMGLPVRDVLELFTSQGCGASPAGDRVLQALSLEPGILALSLPVTIWDHLGWTDTRARDAFTQRQRAYSRARGDRRIYTPQVIVNGLVDVVGSDTRALDTGRKDSRGHAEVMSLRPHLHRTEAGWGLSLPAGQPAAMIVLVTFQRSYTVVISRGENQGRINRYANLVDAITGIGTYDGAEMTLNLPPGLESTAERGFAVLVQAGDAQAPGAILGAIESPRVREPRPAAPPRP